MITLCAEFDVLERQVQASCASEGTAEEEEAEEAVRKVLRERQQPILSHICALPCHTPAGASALAASLLLWEAGEIEWEDDPDACVNDRLLAALLWGLLPGGAGL